MKIVSMDSGSFRIPLARMLGDAIHGARTAFEFVTARTANEVGVEGLGVTSAGGVAATRFTPQR